MKNFPELDHNAAYEGADQGSPEFQWALEHLRGHGVAIRKREDPPIPGEPFMSMDVAAGYLPKLSSASPLSKPKSLT